MVGFFSILFYLLPAHAQDSTAWCIQTAQNKRALIASTTCRWEPHAGNESTKYLSIKRYNCQNYPGAIKTNSAGNPIGFEGRIVCKSPFPESVDEYYFHCAACYSYSTDPNVIDTQCQMTMYNLEVQYCNAFKAHKMSYKHTYGGSIPVDENGVETGPIDELPEPPP